MMDIPQKIKDRIAEIILENKKYKESERKAKEAETARLKKIDDLREAQRERLIDAEKFIRSWIVEFKQSESFRAIRLVRKEVVLFEASFWLGEPVPKTQITTWATLSLHLRKPGLIYRELHKGRVSEEGYFPLSCLISEVHPKFLLQFAEAIRTGKVWEYVERSLK